MTTDYEFIREQLSATTGAPFTKAEPGSSRGLLRKEAVWFVVFSDLVYVERTGHLSAAWKDKEGAIWFETSEIADMITLVERLYGEKGAASMPDVKLGVVPTGGIPEEVMGYPKVVELLRTYDGIVERLSKKHGIELKLLYDGGVGVTTVRIGVRVNTPGDDEGTLQRQINAAAKVLKQAYDAVLAAGRRKTSR